DGLLLAFLKEGNIPDNELVNESGLLHVVKKAKEPIGSVESTEAFNLLWGKAVFVGAQFEERVFSGYNPFGPNKDTLHSYNGYIKIAKSGSYRFFTASTDASFILIDGKPVVSWPGKHDQVKGINNEIWADINLEEGNHGFKYLHGNSGDKLYAIAAILMPGENKNSVIPASAFTEAYAAKLGELENQNGNPVPEFAWDNRQMVNFDRECMHEVEFVATVPSAMKYKNIKWDFGDGTLGEGAKLSHIYFKRVPYNVTMTVELQDGKKTKMTQEVLLDFRYSQSENDDNLTNEIIKKALSQEASAGIQVEGYNAIMTALLFYKKKKEAEQFYLKSALMKKTVLPELLFEFLDKLVAPSMTESEKYAEALKVWESFTAKTNESTLLVKAKFRKAELLIVPLREPLKGNEILNEIKKETLPEREKKALLIYEGDALMLTEGANEAYRIFNSLEPRNSKPKDAKDKLEIENALNSKLFLIEHMISSGKYSEALDLIGTLQLDRPTTRLYAPLSLFKGRALSKLGRTALAGVTLESSLLLDRDDDTDAKIRIELAGLYAIKKEYLNAKKQISVIKKRNPGSLEEIAADKLLEVINRKISEGAE
ncbi:MAG: PKD domain-containing protein, partial [Lentisphaerota bacterium]